MSVTVGQWCCPPAVSGLYWGKVDQAAGLGKVKMLQALEHQTREFTCFLLRGSSFLECTEVKHSVMFYSSVYSGRKKMW